VRWRRDGPSSSPSCLAWPRRAPPPTCRPSPSAARGCGRSSVRCCGHSTRPTTPTVRGTRIDIGTPLGTQVVAPADATVAFAGQVGGQLFVTSITAAASPATFSWLSAVGGAQGSAGRSRGGARSHGEGHPGSARPHLHLGAKLDGAYVDPMSFLGPPPVADLIHLAPDLRLRGREQGRTRGVGARMCARDRCPTCIRTPFARPAKPRSARSRSRWPSPRPGPPVHKRGTRGRVVAVPGRSRALRFAR